MLGSWRLRNWRGMVYETAETLVTRRFKPQNYLVVNGFWRSGTTWVQQVIAESLSARCVYEPLESRNTPAREYASQLTLPRKDDAFVNALFPFARDDLRQDPDLASLLRRALGGGWFGMWSPLRAAYAERTLSDVLCKTIVTKFVRANLCLGALQNEFGVPAIHVYRDPRAVVTSLLYPDPAWGGGTFQDFPLRSHLLEIRDGREEFFSRWHDEITDIDRMPNVARLAAYYCLTEMFVMQSAVAAGDRRLTIDYRALVSNGFESVYRFLESQGFKPNASKTDPSRPSASDKRPGRNGAVLSANERLHSWRDILPPQDAKLVTAVAHQLGLGSRCEE